LIMGTDVRVTIVGDRALAADIRTSGRTIDWRAVAPDEVSYRPVAVPERVLNACVELCRQAGLLYAAFDFIRESNGRWVFLEVNPSGQWGWIEQATGLPITQTIVDLLARPGR
jgi:glutathione synthase/RimK-type ligase-like ATP-grasp enzyme